ncbi:DUF4328 domain-containing protein [Mycobacterium intermedium]
MAPLMEGPPADPRWGMPAGQQAPAPPAMRPAAPRLPPGFRWIAVRPGAAPPQIRQRRHRGPTPRYAYIPRWGLVDRVDQASAGPQQAPAKPGPTVAVVRTALFATLLILAGAALVYVLRYVLLIINRDTLLPSLVALASVLLGYLASVVALVAVGITGALLVSWLIARRAAAFKHVGLPEPRSERALWAGCLVPVVNLFWAPVYVIELAHIEDYYHRLRNDILRWWLIWVASTAISIFAIATSGASDAQGIADNTIAMVVAYLGAAVAVSSTARVFEGFERKPVERPVHRWVVVGTDEQKPAASAHSSASPVELEGQEPAA